MFAAKAVLAAVLITWLVRGGALDLGALRILVERPSLLALNLALFAVFAVIGALRWRTLLGLAGARPSISRVFALQLVAQFFNVVVPGNVGGDVVKALYVARDEAPSKRTSILLIVLVERLVGLAGLVALASLVTAARAQVLFANPLLRAPALVVLSLGASALVGWVVFVGGMRRYGARLEAWTGGTTRFARLLGRVLAALRLLASGQKQLFLALGLSGCSHALSMFFFWVLTRALVDATVPFHAIVAIYPIGILSLMLPVSPSGLGVGHVAFDRLFTAIGLAGGATVFNVYLIGQIVPCVLGVVPYVALRRSGAPPEP